MLEIFQKVKRRPRKLLHRENYHTYRALGKIPTRYKKYADLSEEEQAVWKENVRKSQLKRRKIDPKYRKLLSYRAKEYYQRTNGQAKECSKCHKVKGLCAYDLRENKKTLRPECKDCRKKYNKERYELRRLHKEQEIQASN